MFIQTIPIRKLVYTLLLTSGLVYPQTVRSQEFSPLSYSFEIRGGINLMIYDFFYFSDKKPTKGPGTKGFLTLILNAESKRHWLTNYSFTFLYYQKSLGNNFNPIYADYQIDLINSFGMGVASSARVGYFKYMNTMSYNPSYNFRHNRDYMALLSTNWILNNHGRNQWVGSINLTATDLSINYYNDGGPPINWIGTGDRFDRWWTGGGGIVVHNNDYINKDRWDLFSGENLVEITYNQFTGYSPLAYEISNVLGIDVGSYKSERALRGVKTTTAEFNASAYDLRINFSRDYQFNAGILGSLRSKNGKFWGIQDIIHLKQNSAIHPNNSANRHYIGIITNYSLYESE